MTVKDEVAYLEGNVVAKRKFDLLTCNKAIVSDNPRWLLASLTPRLYRKEPIFEKKLTRELFLDARNIFWDSESGKFNASDSVNLKIEEKTWDMATYSWVIISSDAMAGYRDNNRLLFSGNVKIRDKDRFGEGQRLDYMKDSSTAILSGNAYVETKEWNEKTHKFEKRVITGERIIYNTETKEATSE
jgi:lipopolysaccharide export system protein LptA